VVGEEEEWGISKRTDLEETGGECEVLRIDLGE
jgi:hypothetical protein